MKRGMILSTALALSVALLSLVSSDSTARAQQQQIFRADTGFVTLGPNQVLRLVVTTSNIDPRLRVRFRRMGYVEADNVYKLAAQDVTGPVTLMPNEAASTDIPSSFLGGVYVGVRGVVESNRRNVRVTAMIINTSTGETTSNIIIANTAGDVH